MMKTDILSAKTARRGALGAVLFGAMLVSTSSSALPSHGTSRPSTRVVDADDRVFDLGTANGRPALVVYEDRESATLNAGLKAELSRVAKGDRYRSAVVLVPVADVAKYDYWPVRGFVKDAIRGESKKLGAPIFCDWDGSFAQSVGIHRGTSSVILYGRNGRVLFAYSGKVSEPDTRRLLELLRVEIEGGTTT